MIAFIIAARAFLAGLLAAAVIIGWNVTSPWRGLTIAMCSFAVVAVATKAESWGSRG